MKYEHSIRRYRNWYAKMLRLYSKLHYERFGEGMEQTFNDILRERAKNEKRLFNCALWMFIETFMEIIRERKNMIFTTMRNKHIINIMLVAALILLLPFLAMQVTDEVAWEITDFAIAWILLVGTGLTFKLVVSKTDNIRYKVAVGIAIAAALILVWVNLAVGIIGSSNNPANLMYIGVLAVGFTGAIKSRFQPQGMVYTLFATAIAQILVVLIALILGLDFTLLINVFIISLWLSSALLFRNVALK